MYACETCAAQLTSEKELMEHHQSMHTDQVKFCFITMVIFKI